MRRNGLGVLLTVCLLSACSDDRLPRALFVRDAGDSGSAPSRDAGPVAAPGDGGSLQTPDSDASARDASARDIDADVAQPGERDGALASDGAPFDLDARGVEPSLGDGALGSTPGEDGLDGAQATVPRLDGAQADQPQDGATTVATDASRPMVLLDGSSPFAVNDAGQVLCGTGPCACSDGVDGDLDGLVDLADPECVSSWDNDEASFATGISGDNRDDACQDCFFDGNSGAGDDGCRIPSSCLTAGNPSSGQGNCASCEASAQCKNFCQAYTPNGCDCFGCCAVQLGSGISKNVLLGSGCSIDGNNTTGCSECVPSTTCVNSCGRCELCPGKTLADLPADCAGGSPGTPQDGGAGDAGASGDAGVSVPEPTCDDLNQERCGEGFPSCPDGQSCTFGCCILTPFI